MGRVTRAKGQLSTPTYAHCLMPQGKHIVAQQECPQSRYKPTMPSCAAVMVSAQEDTLRGEQEHRQYSEKRNRQQDRNKNRRSIANSSLRVDNKMRRSEVFSRKDGSSRVLDTRSRARKRRRGTRDRRCDARPARAARNARGARVTAELTVVRKRGTRGAECCPRDIRIRASGTRATRLSSDRARV